MSLKIPPAVNYPSPLVYQVSRVTQAPDEGKKQFNCEVEWGTMGGANKSVYFDCQNNATLAFSQIIALAVDNSDCGADVRFIFPDTQMTLTIPAYSPYSIIEVFTNSRQFYVVSKLNGQTVLDTDVTRFQAFNFLPPPVSISVSEEQNTAVVDSIDMGTASTPLVPAGTNGTLEAINLNLAFNSSNSGDGTWLLQDGDGNAIISGAVSTSSGDKLNLTLASMVGLKVRFSDGINLICTQGADLGAVINANLYYRKP